QRHLFHQCITSSSSCALRKSTSNSSLPRPPKRTSISESLNRFGFPFPPRRTTPDRGQSGATDGLGGRVGATTRRLPRRRRKAPYRARCRTHHRLLNHGLSN